MKEIDLEEINKLTSEIDEAIVKNERKKPKKLRDEISAPLSIFESKSDRQLKEIKEALKKHLTKEPIVFRDKKTGKLLIRVDCLKDLYVEIDDLKTKTKLF